MFAQGLLADVRAACAFSASPQQDLHGVWQVPCRVAGEREWRVRLPGPQFQTTAAAFASRCRCDAPSDYAGFCRKSLRFVGLRGSRQRFLSVSCGVIASFFCSQSVGRIVVRRMLAMRVGVVVLARCVRLTASSSRFRAGLAWPPNRFDVSPAPAALAEGGWLAWNGFFRAWPWRAGLQRALQLWSCSSIVRKVSCSTALAILAS